jgi:hypothetical protein
MVHYDSSVVVLQIGGNDPSEESYRPFLDHRWSISSRSYVQDGRYSAILDFVQTPSSPTLFNRLNLHIWITVGDVLRPNIIH